MPDRKKGGVVTVRVSGHHFDISEAIREHVEETVSKLERFYTPLIDVSVTIHQETHQFRTDTVVNVSSQTLKSTGSADKVYTAVDVSLGKMGRQLKRLHDKRRGHRPETQTQPIGDGE